MCDVWADSIEIMLGAGDIMASELLLHIHDQLVSSPCSLYEKQVWFGEIWLLEDGEESVCAWS